MAAEIRTNAKANGRDVAVTFDGSNGSVNLSASTRQISFKLLVPKTATPGNPAPAIVCAHGFYNNKEMQDQYYVELARRGYVVISLDMTGHGSSDANFDPAANIVVAIENSGMEACVEWLMTQPYVDMNKIGITGHSQGGRACGWTLQHLIRAGHGDYVKASLFQANSAGLVAVLDEFKGLPENLVVGTIMCKYDEFSIVRDKSYDYLPSDQAKNIVRASYPGFSGAAVKDGMFYTSRGETTVDTAAGKTLGTRASIIYWPPIIHPWAHFSWRCSTFNTEFFYASLGIPSGASYMGPNNQIWWLKEFFNLVGLIGFFLLLIPAAGLLLKLPVFKPLAANGEKTRNINLPELRGGKNHFAFWASGILVIFFSAAIFQPLYSGSRFGNTIWPMTQLYPQTTTNTIALWTVGCGVVGLIILLAFWAFRYFANRKNGDAVIPNPFEAARLDSVGQFFRTLLFALTVIFVLYAVVWLQYAIWKTDFRIWTFAVMKFEAMKVGTMVRYAPFFLFFYIINGICNANNRFKNMPDWLSVALTSLFNVAGIVILLAIQYYTMVFKGHQAYWLLESDAMMTAIGGALGYLLLIPIFFVLIIANIYARILYKKTGNIWAGGLINGLLFTIIIAANTFSQFPYILT